jgi:hypothetical protein
MISGSVLSFAACFPFKYLNYQVCMSMCLLTAMIAYLSQLVGFVLLRVKLVIGGNNRYFVSPLGLWGAAFGSLVFLFSTVCLIGFQGDGGATFAAFAVMVAIASVYYYFIARFTQKFSEEEVKLLYIFYVMKRKCCSK